MVFASGPPVIIDLLPLPRQQNFIFAAYGVGPKVVQHLTLPSAVHAIAQPTHLPLPLLPSLRVGGLRLGLGVSPTYPNWSWPGAFGFLGRCAAFGRMVVGTRHTAGAPRLSGVVWWSSPSGSLWLRLRPTSLTKQDPLAWWHREPC